MYLFFCSKIKIFKNEIFAAVSGLEYANKLIVEHVQYTLFYCGNIIYCNLFLLTALFCQTIVNSHRDLLSTTQADKANASLLEDASTILQQERFVCLCLGQVNPRHAGGPHARVI